MLLILLVSSVILKIGCLTPITTFKFINDAIVAIWPFRQFTFGAGVVMNSSTSSPALKMRVIADLIDSSWTRSSYKVEVNVRLPWCKGGIKIVRLPVEKTEKCKNWKQHSAGVATHFSWNQLLPSLWICSFVRRCGLLPMYLASCTKDRWGGMFDWTNFFHPLDSGGLQILHEIALHSAITNMRGSVRRARLTRLTFLISVLRHSTDSLVLGGIRWSHCVTFMVTSAFLREINLCLNTFLIQNKAVFLRK